MKNKETDQIPLKLSIASTFTCNPIEETIEYWSEKFGYKTTVQFSPYDQVFQELLNHRSSFNQPDNDARVIIVKFDDWTRNLHNLEESFVLSHIVTNIHSLCEYVARAASYVKSPLILTIARNSGDSIIKPKKQALFEALVKDSLSRNSNIIVTTSIETNEMYPVEDYYDAHRDELGHIPFKREYFTALGTCIFRKLIAQIRKPYKVVVVDCDNTLWEGVCGESGPLGISITEPYRNLQLFMLKRVKSGKVLCLCSKNAQDDVESVFTERTDMIISLEDIVSSKINWRPKSENIKQLAEELNLGLDSFIFVDDNPVECAEVRANCPEVLTLNLPSQPDDFASFLKHAWPFDILKTSKTDQQRTQLYQDNLKRAGYQSESASLKEFIDGLNLDIRIENADPDELSRVSELSYRTNQFNFTSIRRTEEEIKDLLKSDGVICKVCTATDRFGEYGLVGAMIYVTLLDRVVLDSFLLSCRVLGRGIEYEMLKSVGEAALEKGINSVQINVRKSEKNEPAVNFLKSLFDGFSDDFTINENGFMTSSAYVSKLRYDPEKSVSTKVLTNGEAKATAPKKRVVQKSTQYEQIARELNNAANITQLLRSNGHSSTAESSLLSTSAEKETVEIITEIWENILNKKGIGPDQHFFDVGGTSLKAIEVLTKLNNRFSKNLTIVSLFEHSTIESLVNLIDGTSAKNTEFSKIFKRVALRRERVGQRD